MGTAIPAVMVLSLAHQANASNHQAQNSKKIKRKGGIGVLKITEIFIGEENRNERKERFGRSYC